MARGGPDRVVEARSDGHLELDDLGAVVDDRTCDDVIEGSNSAPTWGERLYDAGVTPWLNRHRRSVGSVAAVVIVLGLVGVTSYVRNQPPIDDRVIAVDVMGAVPNSLDGAPDSTSPAFGAVISSPDRSVWATAYKLTAERQGDVVVPLGLVGPGVGATSAHLQQPRGTGQAAIYDVVVVPGCEDPRALTATWRDYQLLVARTDSYARTVTGVVLPLSPADWAGALTPFCVEQRIPRSVRATSVSVSGTVADRILRLDVALRNDLEIPVTVSADGDLGAAVETVGNRAITTVPAAGTAALRLAGRVVDCSATQLDPALVPDGQRQADGSGSPRAVPGVALWVALAPVGGDAGQPGTVIVATWPATQQAAIRSLLDRMCAGAPATRFRTVSVAPAPDAVRWANEQRLGITDAVVLRARVEVATSGSRVTLSSGPPEPAWGPISLISPTTAPVRGGRAAVSFDWVTTCDRPPDPPQVQITVTTGQTAYPFRATLNGRPFVDALRAACPSITAEQLFEAGWTTAG